MRDALEHDQHWHRNHEQLYSMFGTPSFATLCREQLQLSERARQLAQLERRPEREMSPLRRSWQRLKKLFERRPTDA